MDTFRPGMKSLSLISVVVLFSCLTCAVSSDVHVEGNPSEGVNVSTLKLVIEVCRHGDRSTLSTFPKDPLPYWNWPQGRGQLTPVGEKAHFELGRSLRKKYVESKFLDKQYNATQIYVRSTDVDRTIMSAMSQLAGLYPAGTGSTYDVREKFGGGKSRAEEVGLPQQWQIIPVHISNPMNEHALLPGVDCPAHKKIRSNAVSRLETGDKSTAEEVENICKKVKMVTGLTTCNISTLSDVNDVWVCDEAHGIPVPASISKAEREKVRKLANYWTVLWSETERLQQMRGGALLYEIKQRMQIASGNIEAEVLEPAKPFVKFILLSAHDTTVSSLLSALQIYDGINPPYNSTVFFELHQVKGNYFVTITYNGEETALSDCNHVCPLDRYLELTRSRTTDPIQREQICRSNQFFFPSGVFLFLGFTLTILITALAGYSYGKRSSKAINSETSTLLETDELEKFQRSSRQ